MKMSSLYRNMANVLRGRVNYSYPYSRYNLEHEAIFIHIPKTAGTSIRNVMGAPDRGRLHIDYTHYMRANQDRFERYVKFTVVRNPVDRLHSCFKYLQASGNKTPEDTRMGKYIDERCGDFSDFIYLVQAEQLHSLWPLLRPQSSFVCDPLGTIKVDVVLHQETLGNGYCDLRKRIPSLPKNLPFLNARDAQDTTEISKKMIREVVNIYPTDFALFYPQHK
jgi:chondroitin 4-sulfotransferase 11